MASHDRERRRLLAGTARAAMLLAASRLLRPFAAIAQESDSMFMLKSAAFRDRERIPQRYSCQGENISPPLSWSGTPAGTQSFALVCYDPDAPGRTFYHWAIYDLPASRMTLPEAVPKGAEALGGRQATNDFGDGGYGGPCPPRGYGIHHYHFALFALPTAKLGVGSDARCPTVEMAAKRQALATAELIGLYSIG